MTNREIDQVLAGEREILPSGRFAESVMQAVRQDASTPEPIRFPWLCVLPGILMCGILGVVLLAVLVSESTAPVATLDAWPWDVASVQAAAQTAVSFLKRIAAGWVLLATLLTLACIALPLRLILGRKGS